VSAIQRAARAGASTLYRIGSRPSRDAAQIAARRGRVRRFVCTLGGLGCVVVAGGMVHTALGVLLAGVAFFVFDHLSTDDGPAA
jgi:hypothetical protein